MATLTIGQTYAYAVLAGFTSPALDVIVAIAQAESGLVTDQRNGPGDNVPPSLDRGILQINSYWQSQYTDACCDDPACAFRAGYAISSQGTNFKPWATYVSGAYKSFMTGIPRNPAPLSQLHEPTKDGNPDENTSDNCGETVAAWVVRDIGNEPDCDGDEIHDEVIGQGVIGGSDLLSGSAINPKYAAALTKRAVTLTPYFASQSALVAKCHEILNLAAGDVLANFGGGSQYLNSFSDPVHFSGFGHICAIAHNLSGGLQLMDPWIGGWRSYTDAQLAQMIVWGYIVLALPATGAAPAPTGGTTVTIPAGWTDDGTTLLDPQKTPVTLGFRNAVLNWSGGWESWNYAMGPAVGTNNVELGNSSIGGGTYQIFRGRMLGYTTAMGVYTVWVGQELLAWEKKCNALSAALDAATSAANAATAQANNLTAANAALQQQVASLTTQLAAANAEIATLKAAPPPAPLPAPEADAMVKLVALLDSLGIAHT